MDELRKLLRELDSELESLGARMAMAKEVDLRMVLNYTLDLERWLSRAKAFEGSWQEDLIRRVRIVGEGLRSGRTMEYGLERLMRIIILASEKMDWSQLRFPEPTDRGEETKGNFTKC